MSTLDLSALAPRTESFRLGPATITYRSPSILDAYRVAGRLSALGDDASDDAASALAVEFGAAFFAGADGVTVGTDDLMSLKLPVESLKGHPGGRELLAQIGEIVVRQSLRLINADTAEGVIPEDPHTPSTSSGSSGGG